MSLDDLLRYEDQPRPRPERRWWPLWTALLCAGFGLAGWLAGRALGLSVPYPLIVAVLYGAALLRRAVRWASPGTLPATLRQPVLGPPDRHLDPEREADGLVRATTGWENRISWMAESTDPRRFAQVVQPQIVEIIDERLRQRHGIALTHDPSAARAVLGETLFQFTQAPVTIRSPRELAVLLDLMEAL